MPKDVPPQIAVRRLYLEGFGEGSCGDRKPSDHLGRKIPRFGLPWLAVYRRMNTEESGSRNRKMGPRLPMPVRRSRRRPHPSHRSLIQSSSSPAAGSRNLQGRREARAMLKSIGVRANVRSVSEESGTNGRTNW